MIPSNLEFANPWFFLLFALIPILLWWKLMRYYQQHPELQMSSLEAFQHSKPSLKARLRPFLFMFKIVAISMIIVALARPQNKFDEEKVTADGIDIVIAMDVSGSMLARDFEPDRLGAAKRVAEEFITGREYDRIGLVVFAGESFTQCPVTTDQNVLKGLLREVKSGLIEDGTAIGMGLATAVTRLKESEAKSKIAILLTDGVNNSGFIDPITAAETAKQFGVKTYTIGVGTKGKAPYPQRSIFGGLTHVMMEVQIDEKLLEEIATMTGGRYFRATDNESLRKIYAEIDKLEKTKRDILTISRYTEQFHIFALIAALALGLEMLLRHTFFRSLT